MSSASAPSIAPSPAAPPRPGEPSVKSSKSKYLWVLLVAVVAAGAWWGLRSKAAPTSTTPVQIIRTARVTQGTLARTIRLTGTTAAKDYVSLVAPSLRGSRGDGRRSARTPSSGVPVNLTVRSSKGGPSAAGTGGNSASSNSGGLSSTAGSGGGLSSALQSTTSRVGRVGGSTTSSNLVTGGGAGSGNSLGSTSTDLVGGGGGGGAPGGGGGRDFGLVLQKAAKPGSRVKKGDVVAEFDRENMLNRLDDYRSSVAQTEAAVNRMKAELEVGRKSHDQQVATAKADVDKARLDLKAGPVLGAMDNERLKLALEEAEARLKQLNDETKFVDAGYAANLRKAEMDLEQSRIELRRAEANVDRMMVKAAISGLVVMQQVFRGSEYAVIREGDQLYPGQGFMQIVDNSNLVVNATINQVDVERLRLGQKARVRFDAYPGLEATARVYAIAAITKGGGTRGQYVKEVPVQLRLDTTDPRIIPDLSVSVDVLTDSEEQATIAPLSAIFAGPSGGAVVYVKKGEEWEQRTVQLGIANNITVAVKSGLQPGEIIADGEPPRKQPKQST